MGQYEKAYIYFDTNALECRHSGKALFLSQFTVNNLYYEVENLIQNMGLLDKVEICIPEIVWFEIQEHLIRYFKSEKASMETKIATFRKSFGDLAEVTCEFKLYNSEAEYGDYVAKIASDFLSSPRVNAKIITCPKDEEIIYQVIGQAIHSEKPFKTAKINGKEYTDAGFKDALIFNTVIKHTGKQLGILISNDGDFNEVFSEYNNTNIKMCGNAKEVQMILAQEFNIVSGDMIEEILKSDRYLMQRILTECELNEDAKVDDLKILSCETIEDNVKVKFIATIHGAKQIFRMEYNIMAKELLEVFCELFEESEEQ